MVNKVDLDARAQALAGAMRRALPTIAGVLFGLIVLAFLIIVALPNAVLIATEYGVLR
jgi:hypothetical protein